MEKESSIENTLIEGFNAQSQNIELVISCLNNLSAELRKLNMEVKKFHDDFAEHAWGGMKNASTFWKRLCR